MSSAIGSFGGGTIDFSKTEYSDYIESQVQGNISYGRPVSGDLVTTINCLAVLEIMWLDVEGATAYSDMAITKQVTSSIESLEVPNNFRSSGGVSKNSYARVGVIPLNLKQGTTVHVSTYVTSTGGDSATKAKIRLRLRQYPIN
jgi:hypothetical protein